MKTHLDVIDPITQYLKAVPHPIAVCFALKNTPMKKIIPILRPVATQWWYALVVLLLVASQTHSSAQTGYIYLHKKAVNEENSPDFTFSVSGGPTTVSPVTLNDQPSTFSRILGLGSDAAGGLWATSGNAANAQGNYPIYYRAPNSSTWTLKAGTGAATNIDGGASGTYISISTNDGHVRYFNGTTETDVTGNLPLPAIDVSDNWVGGQYAVLNNNTIWKRTLPSTIWTQVTGQASTLDALPNDPNVYVFTDVNGQQVYSSNGVTQTSLGVPDGSTATKITSVAYTANGTLFVRDYLFNYRWTGGTSWVKESEGNNLGSLTGGPASQLWGVALSTGSATLDRIWSRAETANYLADENVRTSPNDNSVLLPVQAGTYTVTEGAVANWSVSDIAVYETQSTTSTKNIANRTATVVVSAGEVVHVVFENQLVQTTALTNTCSTASTFTETFGTGTGYGPALTGLTSYHRANGTYGYGYYSLINNTSLMGGYTGSYTDHTGDANGRMLAVDATAELGVFYRRRFTNLIPGASYNFSAWAMNVNLAPDIPNVSFEIYDPATGNLLNSSNTGNISTLGVWQQSSLIFTATQSTIDLVLRNNTKGTQGNDLAIDDISFGLALPTTPIVANTPASCATGLGSLTVTSPIGPSLQYSINGGSYQPGTVFNNLAPGVYSVVASYTTANGCSSTPTSVTISLATPPALGPISGPSTACSSVPTSYTYTNTTPGGTWTVTPTTLGTINANTGILLTTASATGTATVTYKVTSPAGCVSQTSLPISVSNCSPMPVSLVSFAVQGQTDHTVLITWITTWEYSNKLYVIERSKDLLKFETVGELTDVAGNSSENSINSYRFVDSSPYVGTSYYRLRQVDQNGSSHVYSPRAVEIEGLYRVYPNPVRDNQFTLNLDEPQSALISLYSPDGRAIPFQTTVATDRSLNIKTSQKLAAGVYLLIVRERAQVRQYRVVVD